VKNTVAKRAFFQLKYFFTSQASSDIRGEGKGGIPDKSYGANIKTTILSLKQLFFPDSCTF
jgi:hypothetical protein